MEALSLLKYLRTNNGEGTSHTNVTTTSNNTTTIVTSVISHPSDTGDEEEESDENDHGPFFDLEFSLPEQEKTGAEQQHLSNEEEYYQKDEDCDRSESYEESDNDGDVKFTLMTSSSGDSTTDVNISNSPTNNLFFNDGFVPVDNSTEMKTKPLQFRLPLVKSATKFRVMMLKFRKLKMNTESNDCIESNSNKSSCSSSNSKQVKQKQSQTEESEDSGNAMPRKMTFKVEEVPIVGLFKRHNSSKPTKKQQANDETGTVSSTEEKGFAKEKMHKYLRKVKPLYVRVSQKYGNLTFPKVTKTNLSTSTSSTTEEKQKNYSHPNTKKEKQTGSEVEVEVEGEGEAEPPLLQSTGKGLKQGNLPAGLRVVCKHFGKSWSATTTVAAAATATTSVAAPGAVPSNRRDDSLLQQQDGIQSAILHCKKSFKASRDSDSPSSNPVTAAGKCENGLVSGVEEEEMRK